MLKEMSACAAPPSAGKTGRRTPKNTKAVLRCGTAFANPDDFELQEFVYGDDFVVRAAGAVDEFLNRFCVGRFPIADARARFVHIEPVKFYLRIFFQILSQRPTEGFF